ncbi:hypothetical protein FB107DRAFT_223645, partial [Schizophyllum commune]
SDSLFKRTVAEFVVDTNQSLCITKQPSFINMVQVASRARDGVRIPTRKSLRKEIIAMWKESMKSVKGEMKVGVDRGCVGIGVLGPAQWGSPPN